MTAFGIDLGATSIRIGYRGPAGELVIIPAEGGGDAIPVAVWFAGPDDVRIGREAAAAVGAHPDEVITSVRAELLGEPGSSGGRSDRHFHGRYESAEAVARRVYADAARRAADATGEPVSDVLIGVPVAGGRGGA